MSGAGVKSIVKIAVALMFISVSVVAGDAEEAPQPATVWGLGDRPSLDQLEQDYESWTKATLAGNEKLARQIERDLVSALRTDLLGYEEQVRMLARDVAMAEGADEVDLAVVEPLRLEFKRSLSILKAKRAVMHSIDRAKAFSNTKTSKSKPHKTISSAKSLKPGATDD